MQNLREKCIEILNNPKLVSYLCDEYKSKKDKQELYRLTSDLEIKITPKNVSDVLEDWLSSKISNNELIEWCSFILIAGCFITEDHPDDSHYDYIWTVISKISTPELDGYLTETIAREYIENLNSL